MSHHQYLFLFLYSIIFYASITSSTVSEAPDLDELGNGTFTNLSSATFNEDSIDSVIVVSHPLELNSTDDLLDNSTVAESSNDKDKKLDVDEETTESVGFGIRSFTVAVTNSEKNSPSNLLNDSLQATLSTPEKDDAITTTSISTSDETENSMAPSTTELFFEVKSKSNIYETTLLTNTEKNIPKTNLNLLFNDDGQDAEINELNLNQNTIETEDIERGNGEITIDKKLDNGLYRIKIAEITTDEFNNGLSFDNADNQEANNFDNSEKSVHNEHKSESKVNMDDFYPSKIEDFKPIIQISNQKILKEKNILYKDESKNNFNQDKSTKINTSKVPTTNIEIELIEDPSSDEELKAYATPKTTVDEVKTNHPLKINTENVFIPRRAKKFDPNVKVKTPDFGMTKFHLDNNDNNNKSLNSVTRLGGNKPEFSTTKFYNSKESHMGEIKAPTNFNKNQKETVKEKEQIKETEKVAKNITIPIKSSTVKSIKIAKNINTMTSETPAPATLTSKPLTVLPNHTNRILSRLEEKINALDCDIQNLSADTMVWRGNETHELNLPVTVSRSA